jgi:hypothetical protein
MTGGEILELRLGSYRNLAVSLHCTAKKWKRGSVEIASPFTFCSGFAQGETPRQQNSQIGSPEQAQISMYARSAGAVKGIAFFCRRKMIMS